MSSLYHCVTCQINIDSKAEMRKHLEDAHHVDLRKEVFKKNFVSHIDGETWYSTTYRWTCDKVTFIETATSDREKNDLMRGEVKE